MAEPTSFNGQSGVVIFASTTYSVTEWNAKQMVEVLDTTTVQSSGWQNNINGIKSLEGSFEMPADSAAIQTTTISAGSTGTFVLTLGATGKTLTGSGRVKDIAFKNPAKGVVTFTANFVSYGVWTLAS